MGMQFGQVPKQENSYEVIDIDTALPFGKFKGLTPNKVIEVGEVKYLVWMVENTSVEFSVELLDLMSECQTDD